MTGVCPSPAGRFIAKVYCRCLILVDPLAAIATSTIRPEVPEFQVSQFQEI
jgi:hypothetical protein